MLETKADVLREICKKATGVDSYGETVVEILRDIADNITPVESKMLTIKTPDGDTVAMGTKHAKDLQENIAIQGDKVTGRLKYVTDFTEFDANTPDNQKGNFLYLVIEEAKNGKTVTTKMTGDGASGKVVTLTEDGIIIYHVKNKNEKIEIMCDGKNTKVLDLSGLTLDAEA